MKISMHTWMRAEPLEVTVARLARCGCDAIQIGGEPARFDLHEVRALLNCYRLPCCGSVTLMTAGRDLISPEPAVRQSSVEYINDCATMAHELGGDLVTPVIPQREEAAFAHCPSLC